MVTGSQTSRLILRCTIEKFVSLRMSTRRPPPILKELRKRLQLDDGLVAFVDPECADEIADDIFHAVAGLGLGIAGVVDDDCVASVEAFATSVREGAEFEDSGDGDLFFIAARAGLLALRIVLFPALLCPFDLLVDAFIFLFEFFGAEGLAIFAHQLADGHAL